MVRMVQWYGSRSCQQRNEIAPFQDEFQGLLCPFDFSLLAVGLLALDSHAIFPLGCAAEGTGDLYS